MGTHRITGWSLLELSLSRTVCYCSFTFIISIYFSLFLYFHWRFQHAFANLSNSLCSHRSGVAEKRKLILYGSKRRLDFCAYSCKSSSWEGEAFFFVRRRSFEGGEGAGEGVFVFISVGFAEPHLLLYELSCFNFLFPQFQTTTTYFFSYFSMPFAV